MIIVWTQLALIGFNLINSRIDAYRILKNKTISHGVNFVAYAAFVGAIIWVTNFNIKYGIVFGISAFLNRQLSFDISLNIRRKLPWFYQSTANPPKAVMDRIERWLFGIDYDGKKIAVYYFGIWIFTILALAS